MGVKQALPLGGRFRRLCAGLGLVWRALLKSRQRPVDLAG
jgi:hypothetical protein